MFGLSGAWRTGSLSKVLRSVTIGCFSENLIVALVTGSLDAQALAHVDHHLTRCQDCFWLVTQALEDARTAASARAARGLPTAKPRLAARFEVGELIGVGGMGAVYSGYDTASGRTVAIKQIRPEIAARQRAAVPRFERESQLLDKLDHPNIVKQVASVYEHGQQYIVMEHLAGGSLRQLLLREPCLPAPRALGLALELCDALGRAHHLGVVHRALKPENVLLSAEGSPKLTDFGLALAGAERLTSSHEIVGTLAYASPETLHGLALDARADLWALGVMLFEMLTGHRPFEADNAAALVRAIVRQPVPDLACLCPEAPAELVSFIEELLQKDRRRRLPSARRAGAELEAMLGAFEPADPCTPSAPVHAAAPDPPRRRAARSSLRPCAAFDRRRYTVRVV